MHRTKFVIPSKLFFIYYNNNVVTYCGSGRYTTIAKMYVWCAIRMLIRYVLCALFKESK